MADKDAVAVAVEDVTLNRKLGEEVTLMGHKHQATDSVNLGPGDSVPLADLTDELRERVEAGEVAQVRVMSADQAEEVRAARDAAAAGAPEGADTSFSDHLVADVERAANLHARAVAESGGEVEGDAPELVGEDEPNSPAESGRKTQPEEDDKSKAKK